MTEKNQFQETPVGQKSLAASMETDSILQFAPLSVDKMSRRREEIVGPNDQ